MVRIFVMVCCLVMLLDRLEAQSYYFRRYESAAGLLNSPVYAIVQDRYGFIWFGTKTGISRFDGTRFRTISLPAPGSNPLRPNVVRCLAIDNSGTLWAGTEFALYRYDTGKEQFIPVTKKEAQTTSILIDSRGVLWFIAAGRIYRFRSPQQEPELIPSSPFFSAASLCESEGQLWCCSTQGTLSRLDPVKGAIDSIDLFSHSPKTDDRDLHKIMPGDQGTLLMAGVAGAKIFSTKELSYQDIFRHTGRKLAIHVHDILRVSPSEYWYATESGIFIYNSVTQAFTQLQKEPSNPFSISDNAVYSLFRDREGGVWAGTYFGGVNYYPRQAEPSFEKFFPDGASHSIGGSFVREIVEDRFGKLWIGTEDQGLNRLDPLTGEIRHFQATGAPGAISYSNVHGILPVNDELWIGTFFHGMDILDIRSGRVKRHIPALRAKGQPDRSFIVTFLRTGNGDIYAGTSGPLFKYVPASGDFQLVGQVSPWAGYRALLEDQEGTVWGGTYDGLYYFNPASGKYGVLKNNPADSNSLTNNYINTLWEDEGRNLWAGLEGGGLCCISPDRKHFTRYTTANGLPDDYVFKILEDRRKGLWVTTARGLVRLDSLRNIMSVYTRQNGLLSDRFNYNSGCMDRSGRLYLGCIGGMVAFRPDSIVLEKPAAPPLYITGFQATSSELPIARDSVLTQSELSSRQVDLPHEYSSFAIDFSTVGFSLPGSTGYSYLMEGLSSSWTDIRGNTRVYFTGMRPGSYRFTVRASGRNFNGASQRSLSIRIRPPFWATAWAYSLYCILAGAALYYGWKVSYRRRQLRKDKELYASKIEFFTFVAHEIKTPVTLIKGPLESLSGKAENFPAIRPEITLMERNTDRLLHLIDDLLDFQRVEAKQFSLDFSAVNINDLLRLSYTACEPLARRRGLSSSLLLPEEDIHLMADKESLRKILDNLVTNAMKYAATLVKVSLESPAENGVVIEISNDGPSIPPELKEKIFEPFYRIKGTAASGSGIGLTLSRTLTLLHKGRLFVKTNEDTLNIFRLELPFDKNV